jgi:hypothetical protein
MPNLVVFSGTAHPQFAQKVVSHLHIPLGAASDNRQAKFRKDMHKRGLTLFHVLRQQ